jgi:NAD(P)-dependent dehydrogenase (short-subunit alcohol dehydrogenase family)
VNCQEAPIVDGGGRTDGHRGAKRAGDGRKPGPRSRARPRARPPRGAGRVDRPRGGPLRDVVAESGRLAGKPTPVAADVGDPDAVHPLIGAASALVGPLEVVGPQREHTGRRAAPGADGHGEPGPRARDRGESAGPFRITKAVVASMLLRGHGLVVGITSDAGVVAYPSWGAYGVSKAALDHLMRTWAEELRDSGVRFLSVDPGEMDTRMHRDAVPEADPRTLASPAEVAARLADLIRGRPNRGRAGPGSSCRPCGPPRDPGRLASCGPARHRLLHVEPVRASVEDRRFADLPSLLAPGDLLVVNDAATLPASLQARTKGRSIEVRLASRRSGLVRVGPRCCSEPAIGGSEPRIGRRRRRLSRAISSSSWLAFRPRSSGSSTFPRDSCCCGSTGRRRALERAIPGGPARPVLVCLRSALPDAGSRPLSARVRARWRCPQQVGLSRGPLLRDLRRRGIAVASLTHAGRLSATGDPAIDGALPFPEAYAIPSATVDALRQAREGGGRVVAVGTTVVRALEGAAAAHGGEVSPAPTSPTFASRRGSSPESWTGC